MRSVGGGGGAKYIVCEPRMRSIDQERRDIIIDSARFGRKMLKDALLLLFISHTAAKYRKRAQSGLKKRVVGWCWWVEEDQRGGK